MKYSIGKMISKSIKENKWLSIDYVNKDNQQSSFWCSVIDIDINGKQLAVDIFNIFKGNRTINGNIYFDNIIKANVVDGTPDSDYVMSGNKISVKALDLNQEFKDIKKDLLKISNYL